MSEQTKRKRDEEKEKEEPNKKSKLEQKEEESDDDVVFVDEQRPVFVTKKEDKEKEKREDDENKKAKLEQKEEESDDDVVFVCVVTKKEDKEKEDNENEKAKLEQKEEESDDDVVFVCVVTKKEDKEKEDNENEKAKLEQKEEELDDVVFLCEQRRVFVTKKEDKEKIEVNNNEQDDDSVFLSERRLEFVIKKEKYKENERAEREYEKHKRNPRPKNHKDELPVGTIVWARTQDRHKLYIGMVVPYLPFMVTDMSNYKIIFWIAKKQISQVKTTNIISFWKFNYQYRLDECAQGGVQKGLDTAVEEIKKQYSITEPLDHYTSLQKLEYLATKVRNYNISNYDLPGEVYVTLKTVVNSQKKMKKIPKRTFSLVYDERDCEIYCISCKGEIQKDSQTDHPIFAGSMCAYCKERVINYIMDAQSAIKTACYICFWDLFVLKCGKCGWNYCLDCVQFWASDECSDKAQLKRNTMDKSMCLNCNSKTSGTRAEARAARHWKLKIKDGQLKKVEIGSWIEEKRKLAIPRPPGSDDSSSQPSTSGTNWIRQKPEVHFDKRIRVLSLFDGISVGMVALSNLKIEVDKYFASEINPDAIQVGRHHHAHGNYIPVGDVRLITSATINEYAPIHLLMGGSPCNDLSSVNPNRKGLTDTTGTGALFFEFVRIKHLLEIAQGKNSFFYLFENVSTMTPEDKDIISRYLETKPVLINSNMFSPMERKRFYWGNLPDMEKLPNTEVDNKCLQQYLLPNSNRRAQVDTIRTVTTNSNSLKNSDGTPQVTMNGKMSVLTVMELERLFGLPEHYTDVLDLSPTKRKALIGRAWSTQVIQKILSPLKNLIE